MGCPGGALLKTRGRHFKLALFTQRRAEGRRPHLSRVEGPDLLSSVVWGRCRWRATRHLCGGMTQAWEVRVGGDDGELRPWHYMYEGSEPRAGARHATPRVWEGACLSKSISRRANMPHIRQPSPDSGLDFQVKVLAKQSLGFGCRVSGGDPPWA